MPEAPDDRCRGRRPDERAAPQRRARPRRRRGRRRRRGADDATEDAAGGKKAPAEEGAAAAKKAPGEEGRRPRRRAGEEDHREDDGGEEDDGGQAPGQARPPQRLTCRPGGRTRSPSTAPSGIPRGPPSRCRRAGRPLPAGNDDTFVVQEHHTPRGRTGERVHWDLRLERDGVLKSWAVPKGPPTEQGTNRLAVPTEDHPLEYASFAGTIAAGEYGGGARHHLGRRPLRHREVGRAAHHRHLRRPPAGRPLRALPAGRRRLEHPQARRHAAPAPRAGSAPLPMLATAGGAAPGRGGRALGLRVQVGRRPRGGRGARRRPGADLAQGHRHHRPLPGGRAAARRARRARRRRRRRDRGDGRRRAGPTSARCRTACTAPGRRCRAWRPRRRSPTWSSTCWPSTARTCSTGPTPSAASGSTPSAPPGTAG